MFGNIIADRITDKSLVMNSFMLPVHVFQHVSRLPAARQADLLGGSFHDL